MGRFPEGQESLAVGFLLLCEGTPNLRCAQEIEGGRPLTPVAETHPAEPLSTSSSPASRMRKDASKCAQPDAQSPRISSDGPLLHNGGALHLLFESPTLHLQSLLELDKCAMDIGRCRRA